MKDIVASIRAKFTKQEYERTLVDPVAFHKWILGDPIALSPAQIAIMHAIGKYGEVEVVAGAKGGKSTLSAESALWCVYRLLTLPDPIKHYRLTPGSNIYIMNIAPKEDLALNIVLNYIRGYAENSWYLSKFIETHHSDELIFTDHIIARAQGSSSRAGLGYAIFGLIMDEVCHFMDTRGNMAGQIVYNNYAPRLLPFGMDGRIVAISTPAGRQGVGYEMFRTGKPIEPYIIQHEPTHGEHPFRAVFQVPTWEMNPLFPRNSPYLEKEYTRDPYFFEMEYGAKFADVVSAFFNLKQLESCFEQMLLPQTDRTNNYIITHDPSLTRDAYALVMGHMTKDGRIRVDLANQWIPDPGKDIPVNVAEVEDYIKALCKRYNVVDVLADDTRAGSIVQRLYSYGLPSRGMKYGAKNDVRIYQPLLEAVNTRGISMTPYEPLKNELRFLERVQMTDRYRVQGAPGNSDDLADCVAMLAYVLKVEKSGGGGVLLT